MTGEERFTASKLKCFDTGVRDNGKILNTDEVVELMNKLHEENQKYKSEEEDILKKCYTHSQNNPSNQLLVKTITLRLGVEL